MEIKNIIFDLGGVIYDIRYENIADELRKLGIQNFEALYTKASQNQIIDLIEVGKISAPDFRNEIRKLSEIALTDEQIDHAWNAILIGVPKHRVELLGSLKLKYKLFLFSNTNQINYDYFQPKLEQEFGFDIFSEIFNEAFMSFEMGLRKPDPEAFEYILKKQGLNAVETLFVDDSPQHVESAKKLGLKTHHLTKNQDIKDLFNCGLNFIGHTL